MSTLKCVTISTQDGSASSSTDAVVKGPIRSFVYFQWVGGVPTVYSSYNVASLTDTGVGIVYVNFLTPFSSSNFVAEGTGWYSAATGSTFINSDRSAFTNSRAHFALYQNGAPTDGYGLNCVCAGYV